MTSAGKDVGDTFKNSSEMAFAAFSFNCIPSKKGKGDIDDSRSCAHDHSHEKNQ